MRVAKLDAAGRHSATTSFSDRVDAGVPLTGGMVAEGRISFSARVMAGGVARVTVRVRTGYSRSEGGPEVSSCDTGSIAWTVRRPGPDAGGGPHEAPAGHASRHDRPGGRFGRRGARGTFELTGIVRRRGDGKKVGSCSTGEISWRASR